MVHDNRAIERGWLVPARPSGAILAGRIILFLTLRYYGTCLGYGRICQTLKARLTLPRNRC